MRPIPANTFSTGKKHASTFPGEHATRLLVVVGLLLTAFCYGWVDASHQREARQAFADEATHLTNDVLARFREVEQELYALHAMSVTAEVMTPAFFHDLIADMHSVALKRSVHAYELVARVPADQIDAFVEAQRETFPEYRLRQLDDNPTAFRYPVKYIEPLEGNRAALGLDIGSESKRREAIERAIDTGQPTLTPLITLVQSQKKTPGFLMFMPVYRADVSNASVEVRRDALIGVALAAIIAKELLKDTHKAADDLLDFELFSGKNAVPGNRLIFDDDGHLGALHQTEPINSSWFEDRKFFMAHTFAVADSDFTLTISSTPKFESQHTYITSLLVLAIGSLLTFGIAFVMTSNARGRLRAETLARSMTEDLEHLAIVAKLTTNGVIFTSPDMKIAWINEGFENITGYSLADCAGKTPHELLACEQTDQQELQRLQTTLQAGRTYKGEMQTRRKNGATYWKILQIQPIFDNDGLLSGYMGFETDINDRKLAEDALRKNRDQFASLVDNIPGVTYRCLMDDDWTLQYLSDQTQTLTGYPASDFLNNSKRRFASLIHPNDLELVEREIAAAIERRESWDIEYRLHRADNEVRWVRERGSALRDGKDQVLSLNGFILDITYQKQAFVQVARQQQMLESMSLLGRIGAWEFDATKQKLLWSSMTKTIHEVGMDFEPVLETAINFYKAGENRDAMTLALRAAMEHGTPWNLELELVTAKGKEIWVVTTGQADFREGRCTRLFGSFQDIDRRKRDELQQERSAALNEAVAALYVHPAVQTGELKPAGYLFATQICHALGVARASVWLFSEDERTLVSLTEFDDEKQTCATGTVLSCGDHPEYFNFLRQHSHIAAEDVHNHPATRPLLNDYLQPLHIHSLLNAVITAGSAIVGVIFAEHTGAARPWSAAEIAFVMSIATLAGNVVATEQKRRTQDALTVSETRLRSLFDLSPIGIALNDFETGNFIDANAAIIAPTGYSKEEFLALSYWNLTPEEYGAEEAAQLVNLETTGRYGPYEKEYFRKDGSRYPVLLNGTLAHDSKGQRLIWSMVEDISVRKAQENALKLLLTQLEKFFELSVNFMCIISFEGRFEKLNHAFAYVLGYREEEMLGCPIFDFIHADDIASSQAEMQRAASGKKTVAFRNRCRCRNGNYVTLQWFSAPDIETGKIYASAVDVTTQQETLQALIDAKDAAESAARLKGEFLATMSHEIRTPMNGVLGMLGLLSRGTLDQEQRNQVDIAYSSAQSLLAIINDILDFSKVESGHLQIETVDFDLAQLLGEITAAMHFKALEKGIPLHLDITGIHTPLVKGDPGRLRQILTNLLGNAIKFTEQGAIELNGDVVEGNGRCIFRASVTDSGIGIPADKLGTLFDAFTQADASTTRKYGGTGLGLAICKKLCQLMGGDITVSSEVGKGSRFEFFIPLLPCEVASLAMHTEPLAAPSTEQKAEPQMPAAPHIGQIQWPPQTRLLVVEDNLINQQVAGALLRELGLEAEFASNGLEAISVMRNTRSQTPYTLIFMDCLMPVMDGFETTRQIRAGRAGKSYQDVPVIALTANAMHGDRLRCDAAGMSDYLSKPVERHQLHAKLQEWLLQPRTHTSRPAALPLSVEIEHAPTPVASVNSGVEPHWDIDAVLKNLGGRKELVHKLLAMFVERNPEQLQTLDTAIRERDAAKVELLAHSIKGSAGQLKGTLLARCAGELEVAARNQDWDSIRTRFPAFANACQQLSATFTDYLDKHKDEVTPKER